MIWPIQLEVGRANLESWYTPGQGEKTKQNKKQKQIWALEGYYASYFRNP